MYIFLMFKFIGNYYGKLEHTGLLKAKVFQLRVVPYIPTPKRKDTLTHNTKKEFVSRERRKSVAVVIVVKVVEDDTYYQANKNAIVITTTAIEATGSIATAVAVHKSRIENFDDSFQMDATRRTSSESMARCWDVRTLLYKS